MYFFVVVFFSQPVWLALVGGGVTSLALPVCVFCVTCCFQFPLAFIPVGDWLPPPFSPSPVHHRPSISVEDWLPSPLPHRLRTTLHLSSVCPSTFKPGSVYCSEVSSPVCFPCRRSVCYLPILKRLVLSVQCYTLFCHLFVLFVNSYRRYSVPCFSLYLFIICSVAYSGTGKLPMGIHTIT